MDGHMERWSVRETEKGDRGPRLHKHANIPPRSMTEGTDMTQATRKEKENLLKDSPSTKGRGRVGRYEI